MATAITDSERNLLSAFRNRIKDLELSKHQKDERILIRWIRARDHDLARAEEMIRNSMEWQKANNINEIKAWKVPADIRRDYPMYTCGLTKNGCPVMCLKVGCWDIKKGIAAGQRDGVLKYIDQYLDNLLGKPQPNGSTQMFVIVDMEHYSIRQLSTMGAVGTVMEMVRRFDLNFPETLYRAVIINGSRLFTALYALIKPILAVKTAAKIQVFGSNTIKWQAYLQEHIPLASLPIRYGGTNLVAENVLYGDGSLLGGFDNNDKFENIRIQ